VTVQQVDRMRHKTHATPTTTTTAAAGAAATTTAASCEHAWLPVVATASSLLQHP